jgi:hypothetical protein
VIAWMTPTAGSLASPTRQNSFNGWVDLARFEQLVELRSEQWTGHGINRSIHHADGRATGPATWLILDNDMAAGQLTVWESGRVASIVAYNPDHAVRMVRRELVDSALPACLDDFTELILHRPPDELLQRINQL